MKHEYFGTKFVLATYPTYEHVRRDVITFCGEHNYITVATARMIEVFLPFYSLYLSFLLNFVTTSAASVPKQTTECYSLYSSFLLDLFLHRLRVIQVDH